MVAGSAPGWLALTTMVGRSTLGSGAIGRYEIGHKPGQGDADRQQRGGDRPADEGLGNRHGYPAACTRAGRASRMAVARTSSIAR